MLFHANRYYFGGVKDKNIFYSIKNELLERFGKIVGQDLQFIEGKKCYSCDGTGLFRKHTWRGSWWEHCWNCTNGMYKPPFWSLLDVVKFGSYYFHQPNRRIYNATELIPIQHIPTKLHGYINHDYTYWSETCAYLLVWYYRRLQMKQFSGGYACGRSPSRYVAKFFHIIYRGKSSIPAMDFQRWKQKKWEKFGDRVWNLLQHFKMKLESAQLKIRDKSAEEKEAELLQEIFDVLPSECGIMRGYWDGFVFVDLSGESRYAGSAEMPLENLAEHVRKRFADVPEEIPF